MRDESELARGLIERIGERTSNVVLQHAGNEYHTGESIPDYEAGIRCMMRTLTQSGANPPLASAREIDGVGHRVVHGGEEFYDSVVIDDSVIAAIDGFCELAPLHNPANLAGIRTAMQTIPHCPHVAVFDTAFFQTMPRSAYTYALPYEWYKEKRVRRYGFHGTSHRYVSGIAADLLGLPQPNLVTLHLGNGCSATCIRAGRAVDQSMGFTPLEGLVMGTRSGDIDPAIIFHLTSQGMTMEEIHKGMQKRGGLLGVSGVSSDLRDVAEAAAKGNERAALAIDVFAHRARKYLGAFFFELGHCDAIVFTGGIGQNASFMREKILSGLEPVGIELDPVRNAERRADAHRISTDGSRVAVWVIPTNEELMIARDTWRLVREGRHEPRGASLLAR